MKISIGAPNLKRVEQGTHDSTRIIVNNQSLNVLAPIGNIKISGETDELRLSAELSKIDASELEAKNINVNLWSRGTIIVKPLIRLTGEVSNTGKLLYVSKPEKLDVKTKQDGKVLAYENRDELINKNAKYIQFKIKNNSNNRHDFFVIGPKADGSNFSYGFPMMPNAKRNENWTVGTKVYKVNKLGLRKLLKEITAEDEGQIVKLF